MLSEFVKKPFPFDNNVIGEICDFLHVQEQAQFSIVSRGCLNIIQWMNKNLDPMRFDLARTRRKHINCQQGIAHNRQYCVPHILGPEFAVLGLPAHDSVISWVLSDSQDMIHWNRLDVARPNPTNLLMWPQLQESIDKVGTLACVVTLYGYVIAQEDTLVFANDVVPVSFSYNQDGPPRAKPPPCWASYLYRTILVLLTCRARDARIRSLNGSAIAWLY